MPDYFIDLTITSPPYDNLRKYNGYSFDFELIAKELYRITKNGGIVVWVVNDQSLDGTESGTSFRQALYFKEIGFNLGDTMIWQKTGSGALGSNKFYLQNFEYMFVFTKGKVKTSNLIKDRENIIKSGKVNTTCNIKSDNTSSYRVIQRQPYGRRTNIWRINQQQGSKHPAPFPDALVRDHMISWSNEGDLIYDPFMGSGTVAKVAILNNRNWIGSEISLEYCEMIKERINQVCQS